MNGLVSVCNIATSVVLTMDYLRHKSLNARNTALKNQKFLIKLQWWCSPGALVIASFTLKLNKNVLKKFQKCPQLSFMKSLHGYS